MIATGTSLLTIDQFHDLYGSEAGYEYWFGEVVRKPISTWLHGSLQGQLAESLHQLEYFSALELTVRIDPNWEPRPDVAGALKIDGRYPTKPIDIAIEILSDDQMTRLFEKCRHYVALVSLRFLFSIHRLEPSGSEAAKRKIWNTLIPWFWETVRKFRPPTSGWNLKAVFRRTWLSRA